MCVQIERHSHGEREAKSPRSDYAGGILADRAYETRDFPLSVSWQVHSEHDIVLWFAARVDLGGSSSGCGFKCSGLRTEKGRWLSSDPTVRVLKDKKRTP